MQPDIKTIADSFNMVSEAMGLEPTFTTDEAMRDEVEREDFWFSHPEARE